MKNSVRPLAASLRAILATAALVISATACASHDAGDAEAALADSNVRVKLQDLALRTSSGEGMASPTSMYVVAVSDHQAAETALGGSIIYDHSPVFVIVITGGHFTSGHAPYGAPDPEGTVLTITVDAATYEVTDVGISNDEPDLSGVASARVELSAN